ncbi:B. burgdorferi predicted coding region BB0530 [hydrothermal vent metagenome]|uniref:TIGR02757 family protein n=1 Tax=hydrothermal vent metagenome TaxID=652676 RepID=A0A3B1CXT7_9ZZZZ
MNDSARIKPHLDKLLERFDKSHLEPDPLAAAKGISPPADIEVALLIAALFAYGRAELIQRNVANILLHMGPSPSEFCDSFIRSAHPGWMKGFKYRFNKREDLTALVKAIGVARERHGSIKNLFLMHDNPKAETILPGLAGMAGALRKYSGKRNSGIKYLISDPASGGASKRWNLFLRWMIRKDEVDPGPWHGTVSTSRLVIPLDTHVARIARLLGMLERKSNDWKAALALTRFLRELDAEDPVKYDFAICSYGKLGYCVRKIDPEKCGECDMEAICSQRID